MSVYIVTDSTSDIPQELVEELPIIVVPLYVILNGKSYLDKIDLTRHTFYESLPTSEPHASTATPAPDQFTQAYDQAADLGAEAIFSIHISQSLSATYQSAETAAKQYQRIPVYPIDSGNLTLAEGLIVIEAAKAAKEGKTVEEIRSLIKSIIPRTHAYAKLDTIDYLKKGGRMSSIQHSVVSILGIKPILKMSDHSSSMEIARTKNKAFEKVLKTAVENLPYADAFGITHANVPDQVEELVRRLKEMIPGLKDPMVSEVTPALGVHVGPGSLCVNWIECEAHCEETEKKGIRKWLP